jgi:hypothetical protein
MTSRSARATAPKRACPSRSWPTRAGASSRYDVRWALGSLGQRPGLYVIDRDGIVRYALLGAQQWEIPSNAEVLAALAALAGAHEPSEVAFPGDEGQRASE